MTETIELVDRLRSETDVTVSRIALNRWPPPVSAAGRAEAAALIEAAASIEAETDVGAELAGGPGPLVGSASLVPLARAAVARADEAARSRERLVELGVTVSTIPESPEPVAAAAAEAACW